MPKQSKEIREWEIEDDLRTIIRANEIRTNKERFKRVKELARKKANKMQDIGKNKQ